MLTLFGMEFYRFFEPHTKIFDRNDIVYNVNVYVPAYLSRTKPLIYELIIGSGGDM